MVASGADSNLSSLMTEDDRSWDVIEPLSGDAVTFDFGVAVQGVGAAEMPIPEDGSVEALFAAINTAYDSAAHSRYDAVMILIEGGQFLVANNGDDVIDGSDIAVQVVGSGDLTLDAFGNVTYTPYVDSGIPGDSDTGIPG